MQGRVARRPFRRITKLQDVLRRILVIETEFLRRPGFHCADPARGPKRVVGLPLEVIDRDLNVATTAHMDSVPVAQRPDGLITRGI